MSKGSLYAITFTGIDGKTDLGELWDLQCKYPYVEWGVLVSQNWRTNGNRYFNPSMLPALDRGLCLSAHMCGKIAREFANGNINPFVNWSKGRFDLFTRCQLNISKSNGVPEKFVQTDEMRILFDQVILQQKGVNDCGLFMNSKEDERVSILLDASGGNGIDTPIEILDANPNLVGYAGGINPENVESKLTYLLENVNGQFWIDMESGVRTDDWFDLDKVKQVLEICHKYVRGY